jgi:hypothetical protein
VKKKTVTAVEVVPKSSIGKWSDEQLAARVVGLHMQAKQFASAAVYCSAAAGAIMLQKKAATEHGQFGAWLEQVASDLGVSERSCQKYMALALEMVERIKLLPKTNRDSFLPATTKLHGDLPAESILGLLAQFDPSKVNDLRTQKVIDLVKHVTGQSTLRQLYFDWNIAQAPKREGGDPETPPEMAPPSDPMREADTDWTDLLKRIYDHGIKRKDWQHLSHKRIAEAYGILKLVVDEMAPVIREISKR